MFVRKSMSRIRDITCLVLEDSALEATAYVQLGENDSPSVTLVISRYSDYAMFCHDIICKICPGKAIRAYMKIDHKEGPGYRARIRETGVGQISINASKLDQAIQMIEDFREAFDGLCWDLEELGGMPQDIGMPAHRYYLDPQVAMHEFYAFDEEIKAVRDEAVPCRCCDEKPLAGFDDGSKGKPFRISCGHCRTSASGDSWSEAILEWNKLNGGSKA